MPAIDVDGFRPTPKNGGMDIDAIGPRARLIRLAKRWSQKKLAQKAGVTPNTIRAFERGTGTTRRPTAKDIVAALGTTLEALERQGDEVKQTDPLLRDLNREDLVVARNYHHAATDVRQRVLTLLEVGEERGDPTASVAPSNAGRIPATVTYAERIGRLDDRRQTLINEMLADLESSQREGDRTDRSTAKSSVPAKVKRSSKA